MIGELLEGWSFVSPQTLRSLALLSSWGSAFGDGRMGNIIQSIVSEERIYATFNQRPERTFRNEQLDGIANKVDIIIKRSDLFENVMLALRYQLWLQCTTIQAYDIITSYTHI